MIWLIIIPLCGPILQVRTFKISVGLKFQDRAECGNNRVIINAGATRRCLYPLEVYNCVILYYLIRKVTAYNYLVSQSNYHDPDIPSVPLYNYLFIIYGIYLDTKIKLT